MRRPRVRLVILHSGGVGAPPGWPLRAARQELADDPGQCPDESAARRRSKNAAVKRRKARRPALSVGGLRRSAPAPRGPVSAGAFGAHPPHCGGHRKGGFRPAPSEKIKPPGGAKRWLNSRGRMTDDGCAALNAFDGAASRAIGEPSPRESGARVRNSLRSLYCAVEMPNACANSSYECRRAA